MVYPVHNIKFFIGTKGASSVAADMAMVKDMETFSIEFDNGVEEWKPIDQEGWVRRIMTAKSLKIGLKGKRNYGDQGNDYVAALAYANGNDAATVLEVGFPNGDKLNMNCVVDVASSGGGEATGVAALEFSCLSDGKPVYTKEA